MIIGVASSGLGHVARGIESWAADLGRALVARGVDVRLYKGGGSAEHPYERVIWCAQREGRLARALVRLKPVLWRYGFGTTYWIEQFSFAWNLIRFLNKDHVDILHVQDPFVAEIVQDARRKGLTSTRAILAHGTEEADSYLARYEYLQHLAPWHLEEARKAGVWRPEWRAIPNFIDTDLFHPGEASALRTELGIPADALVIMTAAAIKRHHKRIDYLTDEFARLIESPLDRDVYLVVAGGWEAETEALIAEAQKRLGDKVRFLVRFPRDRMAELYRLGDIFVLCSLKEMMPVALLEATASALPCVVHQHPVLEWMIGPGGRSIDMNEAGALASTLREWINDEPQRRQLATLARKHCQENFGRDRVVDQILEYYDFIMEEKLNPQEQPRIDSPAALTR